MATFVGLEQFLQNLPALVSQVRRQLYSDNMNTLEYFGRRLQDALNVLNIFKNRCEGVSADRELVAYASDLIT